MGRWCPLPWLSVLRRLAPGSLHRFSSCAFVPHGPLRGSVGPVNGHVCWSACQLPQRRLAPVSRLRLSFPPTDVIHGPTVWGMASTAAGSGFSSSSRSRRRSQSRASHRLRLPARSRQLLLSGPRRVQERHWRRNVSSGEGMIVHHVPLRGASASRVFHFCAQDGTGGTEHILWGNALCGPTVGHISVSFWTGRKATGQPHWVVLPGPAHSPPSCVLVPTAA